jgi:hypothetical protein
LSRSTCLYRHFDSTGKLLYVGISLDVLRRLGQHRRSSVWFDDIARVEIEHFADWDSAKEARRKVVAEEKPIFHDAVDLSPELTKRCDEIVRDVCRRFRVTPGQIRSRYKGGAIMGARIEITVRLRNELGLSARQTADILKKGITIVHHYLNIATKNVANDFRCGGASVDASA